MDFLGWLTVGLSAVWFATEVNVNVRRRFRERSGDRDKLSLVAMWATTIIAIALAVSIELIPAIVGGTGKIFALSPFLGYFGCLVMVAGLVIRLRAIATLGKQFTVQVAIVQNHKIIDKGLYRIIRHPSYLGSLVTFAGLGLALENWLSLLVLLSLPTAATLYRIFVEEKTLLDHFGPAYRDYMRRTKKLIPGIL